MLKIYICLPPPSPPHLAQFGTPIGFFKHKNKYLYLVSDIQILYELREVVGQMEGGTTDKLQKWTDVPVLRGC